MQKQVHLLLTGGTGFFGKALLRHWSAMEVQCKALPLVTLVSRNPKAFIANHTEFAGKAWLRLHQGDILLPGSLPQGDFTHVLHAATDSTLGPSLSPLDRYLQIVDGTRNVLDHAVMCKATRLLLTSSGGVYGPQPPDMERIPETYLGMPDPLVPANAYSVGKRAAEHLCALYADKHGIEIVTARCFAFVGQDLPLDVHFAIGNFIRDALKSPKITVSGDGTPLRSYMDQRDLAQWIVTLLEYGQSGQAYNVGSDLPISIQNLAFLIRDILAQDKPVLIAGQHGNTNFRNRYVPSIAKARTEFGLALEHTLEAAVRETARHAFS